MFEDDPIIEHGAGTDWPDYQRPFPWKPEHAITFAECAGWIDTYLDPQVPITREMILLVMFHETRFSNVRQVLEDGGQGPGVGLAQLEVENSDKPEFFEAVYGIRSRNNPALIEALLRNPVTSIRVQCDYYRYKFIKGVTGMKGMVMAQAGGKTQNQPLVDIFMEVEPKLRSAMGGAGDRMAIIEALNDGSYVIDPGARGGVARRPVLYPLFKRYWDYTLPADINLTLDLRR